MMCMSILYCYKMRVVYFPKIERVKRKYYRLYQPIMGNASLYLEKYDIVRYYKRQDWVTLQHHPHREIRRHKYTHETADVYQLHEVPSREDMEIYDFRNKYEQLVKVYFLGFQHQQGICGHHHAVEILVQHIAYKLEELHNLTQEEALTMFVTALKGFKLIQQQFGPVEPSEELMGVNAEGKVKVWLNTEKNNKQFISDKFSAVSFRVRKLYRIVQQKCQGTFLPYSVKQKFCSRNIAYSDAIFLVQQYAKNNKLSLNKYLLSDVVLQRLVKANINKPLSIGKADIRHCAVSRQISFQDSFVSHKKGQIVDKTLKKTVSLISMSRPQSSLNKSESNQQLNCSRVTFNNPKTTERKEIAVNQDFTEIRFIHNNTPTKIFYSPKSNPKYHHFHSLTSTYNQAQSQPTSNFRVIQQNNIEQSYQVLKQQVDPFNQNTLEAAGPNHNEKEQSDIVILSGDQSFDKQTQFLQEQKQIQNQIMCGQQDSIKCEQQSGERLKQLFTTFGNQKESELYKYREKQLLKKKEQLALNQQQLVVSYGQAEKDQKEAVKSPCFNSIKIQDKRRVYFAEISQQSKEQTQKNIDLPASQAEIQSANQQECQSLQSIDSMSMGKKRKRTSVFAAVEVDYANYIREEARPDEVKEVNEQNSKQQVFGSFSKIGSFDIVRIDSMLEKKYEDVMLMQDRETKFKTEKKQANLVSQQPDQEDFLNVDYLQKSLDKRYSPHLSKRAVEKEPQEEEQDDDVLNIQKLEEGLLKFSKYNTNKNQVKQIDQYSITVKQPEEIIVERIQFLQVSPNLINAASNSIRVADSDSHRVDNWEISDTSINMAIINNREKEREESLKRTSSSSRLHFYQNYGRKNSNFEPNRYHDTSYTKQTRYRQQSHYNKQAKYYNTWEYSKKHDAYDTNRDKYKRDFQFEEKYKKHVQLKTSLSRPTTSYQSNCQQVQRTSQPKQYLVKNWQERPSVQRERGQKQAQVSQVAGRKLTYDQLRQILWN